MRTALAIATAVLSPLAAAQDWSADQLAVIKLIERCNDAWADSLRPPQAFAKFSAACPEAPGSVFWYAPADEPIAYGGERGLWARSAASGNTVSWGDFQPVEVQIHRDVALAYFTVTWTVTTPAGVARQHPSQRLTVTRRDGDRWVLLGGTVTAVPTPTADD